MRLNRVLLLAATINILIFALAFTISCSGDDGKNGATGEGCTVQKSGSDWNIVCSGDVVGTLRGEGGKPGAQGAPGAAGKDGDDCWLGPKTSKGYEIFCGANSESKGALDGCSVKDIDDYELVITCGSNEVNLCGRQVFDPEDYSCTSTGALSASSGAVSLAPCPADGKDLYNTNKQYCGYGKNDKPGKPATIYNKCPSVTIEPNENAWEDQYCRYTDKVSAKLAGEDADDFCDGQKFNDGSWKGQYCGWKDANAVKRTVLTGACDTANVEGIIGPNEISFGQGYCEVSRDGRLTGLTRYTEALCGTSANNKPNNGAWKGEYCGFADAAATEPTKVYAGICDDGKEPHGEAYNAGYCVATRFISKTTLTDEFCGEDGKPNNGTWKGEYCGYGSASSKDADYVYTGICDDDKGPNQDGWNPDQYCGATFDNKNKVNLTEDVCDNGDKINEGKWKGEYCGLASKTVTKTSRQTGVCDDGAGPNSDEFGAGYCTVAFSDYNNAKALNTVAKTTYTDEFCGNGTATANKVNEGSWKGEYCGYASAKSEDNDKVWKGICDNGDGPNKDGFGKGYCQWVNEIDQGTVLTFLPVCGSNLNAKPNDGSWKGEFCFADEKIGKCTAGLIAVLAAKSSDNIDLRCALPSIIVECESHTATIGGNTVSASYSNKKCNLPVANANLASSIASPSGACLVTGDDAELNVSCKYAWSSTAATPNTETGCKARKDLDGTNAKYDATPGAGNETCTSKFTYSKCIATVANGGQNGTAMGNGNCEFTPTLF